MIDFATLEFMAAYLCQQAGGDWSKPYTKRAKWRNDVMELVSGP